MRGARQWYDEAEKRHRAVVLIDFETAANNALHVTWEWVIKPPARAKGNRADVLFVVNGLPVCIVERKNRRMAMQSSARSSSCAATSWKPRELLTAPQLFKVTHLFGYWYGAKWNANRRDMARWKQSREEIYRFAVQTFFEPTDFLRTLRHWILCYVQDGETRKSVLRQHQRRAIDAILQRCLDPAKRCGLIWHTNDPGARAKEWARTRNR